MEKLYKMKVNLIILLLGLLHLTPVVNCQLMTLKDCVDRALQNHPDIVLSKLNQELSTSQISQAKSAYLPVIGINVFQSGNFGRSIDRFTNNYIDQFYNTSYLGLGFRIPIFTSSRIKNQIKAATNNNEADIQKLEQNKNALTLSVITTYLTALANLEIIENLRNQWKTDSVQYARMLKRKEAGLTTKSEELQLLNQIKSDEISLADAQLNYSLSIIELSGQMNSKYSESIKLSTIISTGFVNEAITEEAIENFPQIQELKLRYKAQDHTIKATKAMGLPTLEMNGDYGTFFASSNEDRNFFQQLNDTRNGVISLGLNIPILYSLQNKSVLENQRVQQKITQANIDKMTLGIQQERELGLARYNTIKKKFENANDQLSLAKENGLITSEQLNSGVVTIVEYLMAQNNIEKAANTATQAKYQLILQEMILNFYVHRRFVIE